MSKKQSDVQPGSGIPGADPYTGWILGTGRPYYFPPDQKEWLVILVELNGITPEQFASGKDILVGDDLIPWRKAVRVPPHYTRPNSGFAGGFCTAYVMEEFFKLLADNRDMMRAVSRFAIGLTVGADSLPDFDGPQPEDPGMDPPEGKPEKCTVVIGIIDDGLALGHERFRRADGTTRVEYAWIQDGIVGRGPPPGFSYGSELRKQDQGFVPGIDSLLANATHGGVLEEDEFYGHAGLVDFLRAGHKTTAWRIAHGTHVMDLACGFDSTSDRNDRPIVCVQLPVATTADTSGADLDPHAINAVEYIRDCAYRIAQARESGPLPVIINFSYGTIAGPHDGTSVVEHEIDRIVSHENDVVGTPFRVVLPAGNSHLSRCHARWRFEGVGQIETLEWRVLPDDRTPSFLQIWLPRHPDGPSASRLRMTVTTPGGLDLPSVDATHGEFEEWPAHPATVCEMSYQHDAPPTDRGAFYINLNATADILSSAPLAPSGIWRITLESLVDDQMTVEAWIQRDETLHGHPQLGRQSYFDDGCYTRFDEAGRYVEEDDPNCHIKRYGLISAIATGRQPIVMGGVLRKELIPPRYSAAGPITAQAGAANPHRDGPDALSVSDDSRVHGGVLAAGSRSGSVVAMNGTSVAAPRIVRELARELAEGGAGNRASVIVLAGGPKPPPRERRGHGPIVLPSVYPLPRYWP